MNFIYIWHDGKYTSVVLLRIISTPGCDLEVKVTDLVHILDKMFAFKFI